MSSVVGVTSAEFRRTCGRFASGVTIASVLDAQGTPHGLTVSSFTSVSLDPPLILICLSHRASAFRVSGQALARFPLERRAYLALAVASGLLSPTSLARMANRRGRGI